MRLYPPIWVDRYRDVPLKIRLQYSRALAVRRADPNAFVVLLGRVLDLVCQNRGAQGNTLFERLQDLAQRGEIPSQIAEIAHRLRQLRNIGAHADLGMLTEDEIPIVKDLCLTSTHKCRAPPRMAARVADWHGWKGHRQDSQ